MISRLKETIKNLVYRSFLLCARDLDVAKDAGPALVIAPHPDDESLGCGAVIARMRARGERVRVVIVTDGAAAGRSAIMGPVRVVATRKTETKNAMKVLGVPLDDLAFLSFPDGRLFEHAERLENALAEQVALAAPRRIFSPYGKDDHRDHRVIAAAVGRLCAKGVISCPVYEYPLWFWPWRAIEHFLTPRKLLRLRRVSTNPYLDTKKVAIFAHRSQYEAPTVESGWFTFPRGFLDRILTSYELFFEKSLPYRCFERPRAAVPSVRTDGLTPVVSILIAVLDGASTIARAIESAQKQTVRDIQIVVVDDGSSDGTFDIVEMLAAEDTRITVIRLEKNGGVGAARNVALAHATGTWFTILDADDWYEPRRLEWLLAAAEREKADLVADNLKIYDHVCGCLVAQTHHGRGGKTTRLTAARFFDGDNPLVRHPLGFIQPLIRRQFVVDHQIAYDGGRRVGEDFLFVAEILLNGARAAIIPEAGYVYVHRISPTTRRISPHSHSEAESVFALMARGCDELEQKYGGAMDEPARWALRRRRRILQRAVFYQEAREAVRQKRFAKALRIAATRPIVPLLGGNIIVGVAIANIRFGFFALQRGFGGGQATVEIEPAVHP